MFLFTFSVESTVGRKNPFAVISAFEKAFGSAQRGTSTPVLAIKAHHIDLYPELRSDLLCALNKIGGILIEASLSRQEMIDLLACADCYVSLHRAEGFGLGIAESMYLGKPVIATNYSGNVDYMTTENSYPVGHRLRSVNLLDHHYNPGAEKVYQPGMTWAEPDISHCAQLMKRVFECQEEAHSRGMQAAIDIRAAYGTDVVARAIKIRLAEIERDNLKPHPRPIGDGLLASMNAVQYDSVLGQHRHFIDQADFARTRDKSIPLQRMKFVGTALRVIARAIFQGRINEGQSAINNATLEEIQALSKQTNAIAAVVNNLASRYEILDERISIVAKQLAATELTLDEQRQSYAVLEHRVQRFIDEYDRLALFTSQYAYVIRRVEQEIPILTDTSLVTVSRQVGEQLKVIVEHLDAQDLTLRAASLFGEAMTDTGYRELYPRPRVWYHFASHVSLQSYPQILTCIQERLRQDDILVVISNDHSLETANRAVDTIYSGVCSIYGKDSIYVTAFRNPATGPR